jgi:hypothetical protein
MQGQQRDRCGRKRLDDNRLPRGVSTIRPAIMKSSHEGARESKESAQISH